MACLHRIDRPAVSYIRAESDIPTAAATQPRKLWPVIDGTITLRDIALESGYILSEIVVRYRLEGAITPARDNVVVIVHALTGTPEASQWWSGVVGDGEVITQQKHAVLCANLLGGCVGTTGPRNDSAEPFPAITTRDQAAVLARLLDALDIDRPLLVCGGSLGGMVTLEFAASFPERFHRAVVLAAPAAQTAQGLAWNAIMRRAIAIGGSQEGLALARMVGMMSYRTAGSLESRFGREKNIDDLFKVNEWLYAHGDKLVERFDARSFVCLIDAMDEHDVGRNRGGTAVALAPVAHRITGVGIPGDILFTADAVREWCDASGAEYRDLPSPHGHDAFLLETERVSAIIAEALAQSASAETKPSSTGHAGSALVAQGGVNSSPAPGPSRRLDEGRIAHRSTTASPTSTRPIRIALAGCGHVGGALLDLLGEQIIAGRRIEITHLLVRDASRERPALERAFRSDLVSRNAVTTDPSQLLHGEVDVLVELIGGTTTAHTLVESTLRRGVRVVSANKAVLARNGPALSALAAFHQTSLDYEGAVAAAVPVIRCLRSGAAGVGIRRIAGIVNGTTNVVLERVSAGESLPDAIRYAQQQGYAEADPTRDLSGEDAEDKLRVLAWLAWGVEPASLRVLRRGVDETTAKWASSVARDGDAVKLIASCTMERGALVARVIPERVAATEAWADVSGVVNRIVIESESAGTLVLQGPGAGGRATAGAVYGDIVRAIR